VRWDFVLLTLVHTVGGTFWGSSRRLLDLVQWAIVALQTVSQAAPVSAASLPTFLGTLFRGLAVLRVEGLLLASGCTGEYAFQTDVGVMGTALALTAIAGAAAVAAASSAFQSPPAARARAGPSSDARRGQCVPPRRPAAPIPLPPATR